jgi:hypothetical protein
MTRILGERHHDDERGASRRAKGFAAVAPPCR